MPPEPAARPPQVQPGGAAFPTMPPIEPPPRREPPRPLDETVRQPPARSAVPPGPPPAAPRPPVEPPVRAEPTVQRPVAAEARPAVPPPAVPAAEPMRRAAPPPAPPVTPPATPHVRREDWEVEFDAAGAADETPPPAVHRTLHRRRETREALPPDPEALESDDRLDILFERERQAALQRAAAARPAYDDAALARAEAPFPRAPAATAPVPPRLDPEANEPEAAPLRRGFASGLATALTLFLALLALYALRTEIAAALPAAAPALEGYARVVEDLREGTRDLWDMLRAALAGA